MKSSSNKERVVRLFLAALLESELSIVEIQELLTDISMSPLFPHSVTRLITGTIDCLPETGPKKQIANSNEQASIQDSLYSGIQRRRLSKAEVLHMMRSVLPEMEMPSELDRNTSMRQLLKDFVRISGFSGGRRASIETN
jgi:hypothetical protein